MSSRGFRDEVAHRLEWHLEYWFPGAAVAIVGEPFAPSKGGPGWMFRAFVVWSGRLLWRNTYIKDDDIEGVAGAGGGLDCWGEIEAGLESFSRNFRCGVDDPFR